MEKHFPLDPNKETMESGCERWDSVTADTITTPKLVKRAINTLGAYKAAGADGIFPAMLQAVRDEITPHLSAIMSACLKYTHIKWRDMKVVFLPKPGRDSYQRANAWRPISLTSFLLKTLERLIIGISGLLNYLEN